MRGSWTLAVTATTAMIAAAPIRADERSGAPLAPAEEATLTQFEDVTPVAESRLGAMSARAQLHVDKIQVNDQDLSGVVTDNVAIGTQTGNNVISAGAFGHAAGFMTTIQNTGNNVLIQNATIVNIAVDP